MGVVGAGHAGESLIPNPKSQIQNPSGPAEFCLVRRGATPYVPIKVMLQSIPSPIVLGRGVRWLVLALLLNCALSAPAATNVPSGAAISQGRERPFVLFRTKRWYPMRPPVEPGSERLTLAVFITVPVLALGGLRAFFRRTKPTGAGVGWGRLLGGNFLVLLFLLSTAVLLAEIWYRYFVDTTDSLGFTKISERWVARHWRSNTAGPRDNIEYAPKIAAGKRRVTFVGDSFTAGHGVKDVEDRFVNRLRARHPDWEIHLFASVGLDTQTEIDLLKKALARGYELDEVVLVYCLNDLCDLLIAPGQPFEGKLPALDRAPPWFTRGSYFLDLYYHRLQAAQNPYVREYFSFVKAGYRGDYWTTQQQRLTALHELVHTNGGHLSVMTFPFLHALGPSYEYGFVHEALGRFWSGQDVLHLDLLPIYAGHSPRQLTVNAHDAHPNERAHQLAADAIERVLWPGFTNRVSAAPPGR